MRATSVTVRSLLSVGVAVGVVAAVSLVGTDLVTAAAPTTTIAQATLPPTVPITAAPPAATDVPAPPAPPPASTPLQPELAVPLEILQAVYSVDPFDATAVDGVIARTRFTTPARTFVEAILRERQAWTVLQGAPPAVTVAPTSDGVTACLDAELPWGVVEAIADASAPTTTAVPTAPEATAATPIPPVMSNCLSFGEFELSAESLLVDFTVGGIGAAQMAATFGSTMTSAGSIDAGVAYFDPSSSSLRVALVVRAPLGPLTLMWDSAVYVGPDGVELPVASAAWQRVVAGGEISAVVINIPAATFGGSLRVTAEGTGGLGNVMMLITIPHPK